ncbi:unnamed protein product [Schistosoma intercalatum]|nr:unnamed protein product [Schistosoma intercalatum]CAH8521632.1 unnamed protein product [Schistosoma intercalatum]
MISVNVILNNMMRNNNVSQFHEKNDTVVIEEEFVDNICGVKIYVYKEDHCSLRNEILTFLQFAHKYTRIWL